MTENIADGPKEAIPASCQLFVTGATGFLGSHFVRSVLKKQPKASLLCLARAKGRKCGGQRIQAAFQKAVWSYHGGVDSHALLQEIEAGKKAVLSVEGRLEQAAFPDILARSERVFGKLNLSGGKRESKNLQFWHFAAHLSPEADMADTGEYLNVRLSLRAVELAAQLGARTFIHISTAYVGGEEAPPLPAALLEQKPEIFRNAYEKSKWAAEKAVAEACQEHKLKLVIVRPPILTAPASSCLGGGQTALGQVQQAFQILKEKAPERLAAYLDGIHPKARLDLLSVDVATEQLARLAFDLWEEKADFSENCRILSLPPAEPVLATHISQLMLNEDSVAPGNRPVTDRMMQRAVRQLDFFRAYVKAGHRPLFAYEEGKERQAGPGRREEQKSPPASIDIVNHIASISRELAHGTIDDIFQMQTATVEEGLDLVVFETQKSLLPPGSATDTLLFCGTLSMPATILVPLAHQAAEAGIRLITWETRGFPRLPERLDFPEQEKDLDVSPLRHALDGLNIARSLGLEKYHLAGWSTGALVAALVKSMPECDARDLHLLAGSFMMPGTRRTPFQKNMQMVMARAGRNRKTATQMYKMAFEAPAQAKGWLEAAGRHLLQRQTRKILAANDGRLDHITRQSVRNAETAYQYARQIAAYVAFSDWGFTRQITGPVHLWHGEDDGMAHLEGTRKMAENIAEATLHIVPDGGHFQLYQDLDFLKAFLLALKREQAMRPLLDKAGTEA